jgi:sugar lactone lactonase YvrE
MKREKMGAKLWWSLLVLLLAAISSPFFPVQAMAMTAVDLLPSLDGELAKPTAVAVDGQGRVYVAEPLNNRVTIFSQGGVLLAEHTGPARPISIAVDAAGRIYVGSALNGNVTVYAAGLQELFKLGKGDGEFVQPADIDIDESGQIYVTDKDRSSVGVYSPSGQLRKSIATPGSGDGQLHHPSSLAIDSAASELAIIDHQQIWDSFSQAWVDGSRIQFFSTEGTFRRSYAKFGYDMNTGQLPRPIQVTVDKASRVYVTDSRLNKVMVFTNSNTFLGEIDNSGTPLRTPLGLTMSPTGRLYVTAMLGGRVNVFGIDDYSAMAVLPANLGFTATEGGYAPGPQEVTITNSGKNELTWTATTIFPWLNLPATGGSLSPAASVTIPVEARPEGLIPGSYQGRVKISGTGMEEEVTVTLTVKDNPLQVHPEILSFTAAAGTTPAARVLRIANGGSGPLSWSAVADQAWLNVSRGAGSAPDSLNVYASSSNLAAGSYAATIKFNNQTNGGNRTVQVTLTVNGSATTPADAPALPQPGAGEVKAGGKKWRMSQPVPGTALRGVWAASGGNALAVGDRGTILKYDGKKWAALGSGTGSALHSVWGSSAEDLYCVGDAGLALHADGTTWEPVDSGTDETLLDVWGTTGTGVLAAGFYGIILDDTFTAAHASGVALRSIWGSSAADLFAVGESGAVLRSDGASWKTMVSGTSRWLNAVWGSSGADVFAVGEGGTIIHYDGGGWKTMASGVSETLHGVYGDGPDDVYAVGDNGVVLHYDGASWQTILAGGISLRDVWTADRLVIAVGDDGMILTGMAGAFPWPIINGNIAISSQERKRKLNKAVKDQSVIDLQNPLLKKPETR